MDVLTRPPVAWSKEATCLGCGARLRILERDIQRLVSGCGTHSSLGFKCCICNAGNPMDVPHDVMRRISRTYGTIMREFFSNF